MKQIQSQPRHNVLWAVILCYLLPFLGFISFGVFIGHAPKNWVILCIALLLSSMGSLLLYWLMAIWEASWKTVPVNSTETIETLTAPSLDRIQENVIQEVESKENLVKFEIIEQALEQTKEINLHLESEKQMLAHQLEGVSLEKERLQSDLNKANADLDAYKTTCLQQQEQYKNYIHELQEAISDHKLQAEKKQYQISHLETKVGDLTYEIKTLLKIAERHLEPDASHLSDLSATPADYTPIQQNLEKPINSAEGASLQLKRCLDIAQKITGFNRFSTQISSFLDSPTDSFTLDLRRLCDALRSENNSIIVLYSPQEEQLLFVNNFIREASGWSPEKFVQNFNDIVDHSIKDWKQGIASLSLKPETIVHLSINSRSGAAISVKGHLGLIPSGIFRHFVIGVLYISN